LLGKKRIHYDGGKNIVVKNEKLKFDNIDKNVYSVFWEVEINGDYSGYDNCVVFPDDVVLDIGANYGFFTINSLNRGAKKVYSVEPFDDAYNHLVEISNKFTEVYPIKKAISSECGNVSFSIHPQTSAINCLSNYVNENYDLYDKIIVESIDINTLLTNIPEKINFMKIDCEGAEYDIFQTITNTNMKKIDRMVIETHGHDVDEFIQKRLLENNFKVYKRNNILFAVNYK